MKRKHWTTVDDRGMVLVAVMAGALTACEPPTTTASTNTEAPQEIGSVRLDRPAVKAKLREARALLAALEGTGGHMVARERWGTSLESAVAHSKRGIRFWSRTLGPFPERGEEYIVFARTGEPIPQIAAARNDNCDARSVHFIEASSWTGIWDDDDKAYVSGTTSQTTNVDARQATDAYVNTTGDLRGGRSQSSNSRCQRVGRIPDSGTGGETRIAGDPDDYPDVDPSFTCWWVPHPYPGEDGYWLCVRGGT